MTIPGSERTRGGLGWTAIGLQVFLAVGALGGGLALMLGPRGEILPLPVAALSGSPFETYFGPGLVLFCVLGCGPLVTALIGWRGHRLGPLLAMGVGAALLVWLAVEIAIVGYSNHPPLQAFYLALGVVILAVGAGWMRRSP